MFITTIDYGTPAYAEMVRLREDVVCKPLDIELSTEALKNEYKDMHLGLYNNHHELLGCILVSFKTRGHYCLKLCHVAIAERYQRQGLGTYLVSKAEEYAWTNGFKTVKLRAHMDAVQFYEKLGYLRKREFTTRGLKHCSMQKKLTKSNIIGLRKNERN